MSIESYSPPLDKLLTFGDCRNFREWPNYLELGLGPEHIPDLIRMATDDGLNWSDSESLEVWAPIHAWRALGQLRAEEAIEPLMRLFHELGGSDWVNEELPDVYALIGPTAIPALTGYLADRSHGLYPCTGAAESLAQIGKKHPDARSRCVAALTLQLERFIEESSTLNDDDITLNGFIIGSLIDLKAVESAPVIEHAFTADRVDEFIMGDWEDVQIYMGLKEARETSPEQSWIDSALPHWSPEMPSIFDDDEIVDLKATKKAKAKKKVKRKQEEKSRKINRKKKRK